MVCELVAVGTELLLGEIANTDAQMISRGLSEYGITVYYHTVCGDNPERLRRALEIARGRADIILTTGGLGPTADDLTKETVASVFGRKLYMDEEQQRRLHERMGPRMTPNNEKQAMLPEGCTVLVNDWGTAPGCAFESEGKTVIMLPGPPRECEPMFRQRALPYLAAKRGGVIASSYVKIFGIGESAMEMRLKPYFDSLDGVTAAPYAKEGECEVRVTAMRPTREEAERACVPVVARIREMLGADVYGVDVSSLEEVVIHGLRARGLTLAVAESCTGGLLGKRLTDIPGASACFLGGCIAYTDEIKRAVLGVSAETLAQHTAVSEQTAREMARGALRLTGADVALAVTGYAGPGGTEEQPAGLVYIALSHDGGECVLRPDMRYARERARVRHSAASRALDLLRRELLL